MKIVDVKMFCGSDVIFIDEDGTVYFMTSTGISTHCDRDDLEYRLAVGSFRGVLDISYSALPLARKLLEQEGLCKYTKERIRINIKLWEDELEAKNAREQEFHEFRNLTGLAPRMIKSLHINKASKKHDDYGVYKKRKFR